MNVKNDVTSVDEIENVESGDVTQDIIDTGDISVDATDDLVSAMPVIDDGQIEGETSNGGKALSNTVILSIVIGVCVILGIVLGIIFGKRAANK